MTDKIVVLMTCGTKKEAERLAQKLVEARLAGCVNILASPVGSVYRWKGRVETAREALLFIKSSRKRFRELEREIQRLHSYELPEIIALPISEGSQPYLQWLVDSVRPKRRDKTTRKRK